MTWVLGLETQSACSCLQWLVATASDKKGLRYLLLVGSESGSLSVLTLREKNEQKKTNEWTSQTRWVLEPKQVRLGFQRTAQLHCTCIAETTTTTDSLRTRFTRAHRSTRSTRSDVSSLSSRRAPREPASRCSVSPTRAPSCGSCDRHRREATAETTAQVMRRTRPVASCGRASRSTLSRPSFWCAG